MNVLRPIGYPARYVPDGVQAKNLRARADYQLTIVELCASQAERRMAHAQLIAELERQAGVWYRARLL
jgi:hypothetical protein